MIHNDLTDKTISLCVTNDNARSVSFEIYLETGKQGRLQQLGIVGNKTQAIHEARSLVHEERVGMTEDDFNSTRYIVVFQMKKNGYQILDPERNIGKIKWVDEERKRILRIPVRKYCNVSYAQRVAKAVEYLPMK
jgi:hypothetical protein